MRTSAAIIFYTIFLTVYTLLNWYIFVRGKQVFQEYKWLMVFFIIVCIIGYSSLILSLIFEKSKFQLIAVIFKWISSYWLAYMLYIILSLIVIDLLRLINYGTGFFPGFITNNISTVKIVTLITVLLTSTTLIIIGYSKAKNTKVKNLSINIPRKKSDLNKLKILFVSDIHLGGTVHKKDVQRLVDIVDKSSPDIILYGGDLLDSNVSPAISNNAGQPLKKLNPPLGAYAITGNHEYLSGDINNAAGYIESLNIKLIRDTALKINNSFYLVGREDKDMYTLTGKERLELKEIMEKIGADLPVILLDHQPFKLEYTANMGVDLQLSGHTHNGQMWPLNYLTEAIFEKSWGYLKKKGTHFYISCGFGVWGPKVRLGSHSEIVLINIKFVN